MVLANPPNPPYSIKQWNRDARGRNTLGTPPQGRADYAFFQHILASLDPQTGRCAILFPHGVLFRQEEHHKLRKLIESDQLDCVLGLEPNLFFNSSMEACVVICCTNKPPERQGRVFFVDAVNEIAREQVYMPAKIRGYLPRTRSNRMSVGDSREGRESQLLRSEPPGQLTRKEEHAKKGRPRSRA